MSKYAVYVEDKEIGVYDSESYAIQVAFSLWSMGHNDAVIKEK